MSVSPREYAFKLSELAAHIGGERLGDGPDFSVRRVAALDDAGPEDLSFLTHSKYRARLRNTRAGAILAGRGQVSPGPFQVIQVDNPYLALARILQLFFPATMPPAGVHPTVVKGKNCRIGENPRIAAGAVLGCRVHIGRDASIFPGVVIGDDCQIGNDVIIYPNVVLYHGTELGNRVIIHASAVIGSDGFGFARDGERYEKVPQVGRVVIEDDVEIGAGVTIDRGSMGVTVIRQGVKLDNLVHIAHNVHVGLNTVMAAQTGISGSTHIGDGVTFAGQVGVAGHITIGDRAVLTGKCGVTKSVPGNTILSGYPSAPHKEWLKRQAVLRRAVRLKEQVEALERRVAALEKQLRQGKAR